MAAERGRKISDHDEMAGNTQRPSEQLSEISVADVNTFLGRRAAQVQLGASPAQRKRRKFEGNEHQAAYAMEGVATVESSRTTT